ncbi:Rrf2 family transcriptional regulator [Moheibacter sediminis]|uniref:Transcriptional regulator, BadM/Rrf2 family n=1 Tax=Moheibacter sediminis TaxID=1434700 RepID=A0A1W1Z9J1_9FLAO|nr:Rrf2 family transcriptional regulator [Moheibacter sediminis]SMC45055.1 transcriptional regulator, BadM/Rrf2 family [Moheibacter sediminis]
MNNTRFATAIHILTLLASEPDEWLSSEYIAGSINVNPVVIRREIGTLNEAGLIITKKGKDGGVRLNKSSQQIFLSDIYNAVKNSEILGRKNKKTNPDCPIGKQINEKLENLFEETNAVVSENLNNRTLAEFFEQFKH